MTLCPCCNGTGSNGHYLDWPNEGQETICLMCHGYGWINV